MDAAAFEPVTLAYRGFHACFTPNFGRRKTQDQSLITSRPYWCSPRTGATPRTSSNRRASLPSDAALPHSRPWDDDAVMERLQQDLAPRLGHTGRCGWWTSTGPASRIKYGAGWRHHVTLCLPVGASILILPQAWGDASERGSPVSQVVWEMLLWEGNGPDELLGWLWAKQLRDGRASHPHERPTYRPSRIAGRLPFNRCRNSRPEWD